MFINFICKSGHFWALKDLVHERLVTPFNNRVCFFFFLLFSWGGGVYPVRPVYVFIFDLFVNLGEFLSSTDTSLAVGEVQHFSLIPARSLGDIFLPCQSLCLKLAHYFKT